MSAQAPTLELNAALPHNKDAEEYILGGILMENSSLDSVTEIITPDDFYSERHHLIYDEMLSLRDKGIAIDIISLPEALNNRGNLERVGGISYIALLAERVPTTANLEYYAGLVKDKAVLRSLIVGAGEIIKEARTPHEDVSETLEKAEGIIFRINQQFKSDDGGLVQIGKVLPDLYQNLSRIAKGEADDNCVATPFPDLNEKFMGGLHGTDLIIIAARPAMGKTSLVMNLAQYAAVDEKSPVVVFSLEMGREQLALRMLASVADIDQTRIRSGMLKREEWSQVIDAMNVLSESPLYIDDTPGITPMDIRAKLRRLAIHEPIGLVVIDYLQLMQSRNRNISREQEISEISRNLKHIAKEFKVPVIALSQLNRKVEGREDKRPMMSELRESGAIEQDADIICFIYREDFYNPETPEKGIAEIIISKHRNGPIGTVKLKWKAETTTFLPLDTRYSD